MMSTSLIKFYRPLRLQRTIQFKKFSLSKMQYDDSKSNNGDENNTDSKSAKLKLQELLSKIAEEANEENKKQKNIELAKPVKRVVENRPTYKIKMNKIPDPLTKNLVSAVKGVADELGGDVQQTERELLHVVLNNKKIDKSDDKEVSLKDVIASMTIEKEETRADQIRKTVQRIRESPEKSQFKKQVPLDTNKKINLFGGKRLNIFSQTNWVDDSHELQTWAKLMERELRLLVTHPPTNVYEEMILWTQKGKFWKFPLDNEQGLENEMKIHFSEHVFLEKHLHPWCPTRGPIKHFMDLVLVGLSKNPYITVQAKIDHIHWFRDYFEEKRKLLESVGAYPSQEAKQTLIEK